MPVAKITADQFANRLNIGIHNRNTSYDTEIGAIPDIVVQPVSQVLEQQNDRILTISQLISLNSQTVFQDTDVDNFVFNENIIRNVGGRSSSTIIFSRSTPTTIDLVVQRGYPIATQPDESTGETAVFATTEQITMYAALSSTYFNPATNRYELEVAIQCTVAGQLGEVGPNRVIRPLRPLNGFDKVYNRDRTSSVVDREDNNSLLERYKISILGTQLATNSGLNLYIRSNYPDVGSVLVVNAGDPLITRTGSSGNAVDIFISGIQSVSRTDSKTYVGLGQLISIDHPPIISIVSVVNGATTYTQNTDYILVLDVSGVSGSSRAVEGIKFIPGGISPAVGDVIQITYQQNGLIENIQGDFTDPDHTIGGQDTLLRAGTKINIILAARLITLSGFSWSTVATAVTQAILTAINSSLLDADIEQSDLQAIVRQISGVDNFIFTRLDRKPGTGNSDIVLYKNEYAAILSSDISLTT